MTRERTRSCWALPAAAVVLATGVAAVPAMAAHGQREQAKRPTLVSLAKQVAALRAQDAILRRRITTLSKRGAVAGVAGSLGPQGARGLQGPAGLQGPPGAQGPQGDPGPVGARLVGVTRTLAGGSAFTPVVTLPGLGTVTVTCGSTAATAAVALSVPADEPVDAYTQLVNTMGAFPGGQRFLNGGSIGFVQMPLPWGFTVQLAGTVGAGPAQARVTVAAVPAGGSCAVSVFGWVTA